MKERTLLLSPCGGCKDHGSKKKAWETIGKFLSLGNALFGQQSSPQKDAAVAGWINAAAAGNPNIPNVDGFKDAREAYDKLMAECGFQEG